MFLFSIRRSGLSDCKPAILCEVSLETERAFPHCRDASSRDLVENWKKGFQQEMDEFLRLESSIRWTKAANFLWRSHASAIPPVSSSIVVPLPSDQLAEKHKSSVGGLEPSDPGDQMGDILMSRHDRRERQLRGIKADRATGSLTPEILGSDTVDSSLAAALQAKWKSKRKTLDSISEEKERYFEKGLDGEGVDKDNAEYERVIERGDEEAGGAAANAVEGDGAGGVLNGKLRFFSTVHSARDFAERNFQSSQEKRTTNEKGLQAPRASSLTNQKLREGGGIE